MKPLHNAAWLYLAPALLILAFAGLLPLIAVFNYSFFDIFTLDSAFWIGPDWYCELITSPRFHAALARSLLFSALVLTIQIPLGLAIALLLKGAGRWRVVILMLVALPLVTPWNMIPSMWLMLLDPETGALARSFSALGVTIDYKFTALHTWIVILAMDTWHWLGLTVVLAFAGLSGISPAYYQAAAIDGASRAQVFRYIELPRLWGVLSMAVLLRFVDSFMIYTEAFRINAGGPNNATAFLALDLGEEIAGFSYGAAAARSVVYFLMVLTFAWAFRALTQRQTEG